MPNEFLRDLDDWDEESQRILLSLAEDNAFISFEEMEKGILGKDPFEKIRIKENSDRLVSPFYKEFGIEEGESIKVDVPISIFNYTGKKTSTNKKATEEDPPNEKPTEEHGYAYEMQIQVEDTGTKVFEAYKAEKNSFNPYHVKLYYEKLNNQYFNFSGRNCIVNIGNTYYQNIMSHFPEKKIRSWYDNRTKSIIVDSIELEAKYTKLVLDSVHQDNQLSEVDIYKAIKLNAWSKSESGSVLNAIGNINDGMAEAVAKIAEFIGNCKIEEKRYLADRDDYQPYLVEKAASSPTVISIGIGISVLEKLVQKNLSLLKKLTVENYLPSGFKKAIEELTGFTTKVNTMIKSAVTIVTDIAGEYLKLVNAFVCGLINGLISLFEFLFQIISFIISLDASIKSYEDYLEQQKNIETLEEVLNFLFSETSTFLDGFIDLIKDLKNTTSEDFEALIKSLSEKLGNISRYQYYYYVGNIVFEVIIGVLLAVFTGGAGNAVKAANTTEKFLHYLKIIGREFISTVTFGITDLLAILRKLLQSFARACKNGFKGFIEWIRSLLKTESKHLDEVLDNIGKKIEDLIPNSRKYLKGEGDPTKTFAENAGFKLEKFISKTKVFGQSEDYTCVATSLKMVLKDKNIVKSEEYLAQALNTNKDGARIKDIPDALYNSYLDDVVATYEEKIKFSKLLEKLDVGDKAIVSVGTNEFKGHAMVLEKVENGKVFLRDPLPMHQGSSYTMSLKDFEKIFKRKAVIIKK